MTGSTTGSRIGSGTDAGPRRHVGGGDQVFWGSHDHVLDDKGRTSLPKDFREGLASLPGTPWITAYPQCLAVLPQPEFEAIQARLSGPAADSDSVQHLKRLILGMAAPCAIDKQGRILVPPKLRKWAGLERDIVFTGIGERIEIWDHARHERELEQTRDRYPEYTKDLREQVSL